MKTAISIEDRLFEEAEVAAKQLGLTRSALFSQAVEEFIRTHMPNEITKRYNEVHVIAETDKELENAAIYTLSQVEW